MEPDISSGAEHLLRAARDARLPDAEIERRVARKNAVVAHALQARRLPLPAAQDLLYHADLHDALDRLRPACVVARSILEAGCALASLEDRLLKWSPDYEPALDERLAFLLLCGERALAPDDLVQTLRQRPTLTQDEVGLTAALANPRLLPVLLRTLTADLTAWPARERQILLFQTLAVLDAFSWTLRCPVGVPRSSGKASEGNGGRSSAALPLAAAPPQSSVDDGATPALDDRLLALPNDVEAGIERWRRWWEVEGGRAYSNPLDALPERPHAPPPPVALLPEGGGEYTLDPPAPFYYLGRRSGHPEIISLCPRRPEPATWRARLTRAAAVLLEEGEPEAAEYEGVCALHGQHIHPSRPGEGLLLTIPDPTLPVAWLSCTDCGQSGYVQYALRADLLCAP
jgi:hypothetical protein